MSQAQHLYGQVSKLFRFLSPLLVCGVGSMAMGGTGSQTKALPPAPTDQEIQAYLSGLDLSAKVGQMIQAEVLNIQEAMKGKAHPIRDLGLGSVLAGGNSIIEDNSPAGWRKFLGTLQAEANESAAAFPLLTGVDAVHGHAIVKGATVFPHNIGLGAARNPELMHEIGRIVAKEVLSTGFNWTFAPAVSVARDARWGRTYESLGAQPELQTLLAAPFIHGLQETAVDNIYLSATAKHFLGDGGTIWGTGFKSWTTGLRGIDRGDTRGKLPDLMALHGQGYIEAIDADVNTVMVSYNSINGIPMHAHTELVANYLKVPVEQGGLGFQGIVVSDWNAIDEIPFKSIKDPVQRYKTQIVKSVMAGVDMLMVEGRVVLSPDKGGQEQVLNTPIQNPSAIKNEKIVYDSQYRYERVHQFLLEAVKEGLIPMQRIDDAVSRILRVKLKMGLNPAAGKVLAKASGEPRIEILGDASHREVARAAVRESLVLLKNTSNTLPISKGKYKALCVVGSKADDFGIQAGAWTTGWQGTIGNESKTAGAKTILDGLREKASAAKIPLYFAKDGAFSEAICQDAASLTLVVIGEKPYAEFLGDSDDLNLLEEDVTLLEKVRQVKGPTAVILISGRPLLVTEQLDQWQALVAAWLPGSQGEGIADVLFGDSNFKGKLSLGWPSSMSQVHLDNEESGLFPYGFGLQY